MTNLYLPDQERVSQALLIDSNLMPFDTSGDTLKLCVPRMLMPNIIGLLLILTRNDVYDYGINYDERDERVQFIYQMIADIGACMLDCNEVIACLTSSTEYGMVARYTLDGYKSQWQAQNDELYSNYDNTPQSIAPDVNSTVSTQQQDSINRLCQAVEYWLTEYREKKRTEITYALYGTMALSGIALALTAATFGAFTLIGGIVIGATVTAGVTLSAALAAIENDAYYDDVKCALVAAAHEGTLTWTNFDTWLVDGKVNLFGELVENDCSGDFGSFASFVQWLSYMQNAVDPEFAEDCDCVEGYPTVVCNGDGNNNTLKDTINVTTALHPGTVTLFGTQGTILASGYQEYHTASGFIYRPTSPLCIMQFAGTIADYTPVTSHTITIWLDGVQVYQSNRHPVGSSGSPFNWFPVPAIPFTELKFQVDLAGGSYALYKEFKIYGGTASIV